MASDPKNIVALTGGIVNDPELFGNDKTILKFRIGVDWAGQEKDTDNNSGYFDVTYFLGNDSPNTKFVANQFKEGNIKKGTPVQLVGRLVHERWEKDGQKNSRVSITAESLTYAGPKLQAKPTDETTTTTTTGGDVPDF